MSEMIPKKLRDVIDVDRLRSALAEEMRKAGVDTIELLKRDDLIDNVAVKLYKTIPLIPFRAAIKVTIGKNGFVKLIFHVRDRMVTMNSHDLTWLNREFIESKCAAILRNRIL